MAKVEKTKKKTVKKQSKYLDALNNNNGAKGRVFTKKAKQVISQLMVQDMALGMGLDEI